MQDVTERINNEKALQTSQQQRSLIYNSAIDPMWLIEIEGKDQYRFVDINQTFTAVTGLTPDRVIGKRMEEVIPPAAHEQVRSKYNEAIETGNVIDYIEISEHPAGKRVGEIRVIPVKDSEGKVNKLVGIANDRTDRARAEEESNELNQRLRDFTAHLQEVIEEERAEIAREIHDELGQQLTAIKMDVAWVAQKGAIQDKAVEKRLTDAMDLLDVMVNTVRRIAMDLRPSLLDDLGLQVAMIWFAEEFEKRSRITCTITINNTFEKVDQLSGIALFRVFQESLTNIKRHSKATEVNAELALAEQGITLQIQDNGQGFDVKQQSGKQTLGLLGMEERVRKLNGEFSIQSEIGKGTTIYVRLPRTTIDQND